MKSQYYADRTYSIVSFLKCICLIIIFIIIKENLDSMNLTNTILAKSIHFLITFFYIMLIIFGFNYLKSSIDSRINPIITICSHFIIMGVIFHEIISWDQIVTVSLNKNTLSITYDTGINKKKVKKSINHVLNKGDLIHVMKEYCKNNHINFTEQ